MASINPYIQVKCFFLVVKGKISKQNQIKHVDDITSKCVLSAKPVAGRKKFHNETATLHATRSHCFANFSSF